MADFDGAAVERDIALVLAACLPADWPPAPAEPKCVIGCVHPLKDLMIHMNLGVVVCQACDTQLSNEEVGYRMDRA